MQQNNDSYADGIALIKDIVLKSSKDFSFYAENFLKIRSKEGKVIPFCINKSQKYVLAKREQQLKEKGYVRMMLLKGRQMGSSTLVCGLGYYKAAFNPGHRTFILAHEEKATSNLFEMTRRFHEQSPDFIRPDIKKSNSTELVFKQLDSSFVLGTAKNKSTGRSQTVQFLHASEAAFYDNAEEHAKGVMQTVPLLPGSEVYIESTANGVGNWFHQMWQQAESGDSEYLPIFLPWFWDVGYKINSYDNLNYDEQEMHLKSTYYLSDEQLMWRRIKIKELTTKGFHGDKAFQQEYPSSITEAFNSHVTDIFIKTELVIEAQKSKCDAYGPLLIGCDPARFGDDRTAIIRRKGRVAFKLQTYRMYDTMSIVGLLVVIIKEEKPHKVFIDVCGLGAGIVDRLIELGYREIVVAVNSAERALIDNEFNNKRAEIWAEGKEWLEDKPVQLPDSPELLSDLCSCKYGHDSKGRLKIEGKKEQKSRGIRSSDTADALLLTFALPVSAYDFNSKNNKNEVAAHIMENNLLLTTGYDYD